MYHERINDELLETGVKMDPVSAAAAATAAIVMKDAAGKVLGPTFELYGQELRKLNEDLLNRRRENVARIFTKAQEKLGDRINQEGSVHPKVLKEILDDGSYAEDELAAEYFGGVLAASRIGVDRDDRGAMFAKLAGRLSVYELRSHYAFYFLFRRTFEGANMPEITHEIFKSFELFISFDDYISAMDIGSGESLNAILSHALHGLYRENLVYSAQYASRDDLREEWSEAPAGGILVQPSPLGMTLYLWAHGLGHVEVPDFFSSSTFTTSSVKLPELTSVRKRNPIS